MTDSKLSPLILVRPSLDWLPAYEHALARGWSPDSTQDVSQTQLARLREDPERFLHELYNSPTIRLADGREVSRLPAHDFWISDGEFCGRISFRFQPGIEDLPPTAMGHIGYTIVPWKRRLGYATQALRLILPVAHSEGFVRVLLTCDDDNVPSQKVILANGGVQAGKIDHQGHPGRFKLKFWVPTREN